MIFSCSAQGQSRPVVNEIQFRPLAQTSEWIEILNVGPSVIDLSDYSFADAALHSRGRSIPLASYQWLLGADEMIVLVQDSVAFATAFGGVQTLQPETWPVLNNSGDTSIIYFRGAIVDSVAYRSNWGHGVGSLERIDPLGPSSWSGNWATSESPVGGTPGRENSVHEPDLHSPTIQFIEQAGRTATLFADEHLMSPKARTITAIRPDGSAPLVIESGDSPFSIRLTFRDDERFSEFWIAGLRDVRGNELEAGQHEVAHVPVSGDLVINEIMAAPILDAFDGRADQAEFVEVFNGSRFSISLKGLRLGGPMDEQGNRGSQLITSDFEMLKPGGYGVLHAGDSSELRSAFPGWRLARADPAWLAMPRALGLHNETDTIALVNRDSLLIAEVTYEAAWHASFGLDGGRSLERLAVSGPSMAASNWTTSVDPDGATPGRENSSVSISEPPEQVRLVVQPEVFSPDGDGHEDVAGFTFNSGMAASVARFHIYDVVGNLVRRVENHIPVAATGVLTWDGNDESGGPASQGVYVGWLQIVEEQSGSVKEFVQTVVLAR